MQGYPIRNKAGYDSFDKDWILIRYHKHGEKTSTERWCINRLLACSGQLLSAFATKVLLINDFTKTKPSIYSTERG